MTEVAAVRGVKRMLWRSWWLGCSLAITVLPIYVQPARAEAPPPPAAFWNYLLEFGDANGEVFDPNDLAVTAHVQVKNAAEKRDAASGQPNADSAVEQQRKNHPASAPVAPAERSE